MCVDFGAGWLWFIRSPLKNRCGKGNEMHKKRGVCVLSVSDHGFFFFTIHYPRLCAWVKKKCAFEPVVLLLLFVVYARVASWFIVIVYMQRVYAHTYILLYYYTICEPPPVATWFLLLGMLTFSTTDGTTFISIAIKAARISHHEHDFKILTIPFCDTLLRAYVKWFECYPYWFTRFHM